MPFRRVAERLGRLTSVFGGNLRIHYRRKGPADDRLHAALETQEFIEEYRQARDGHITPARPRADKAAGSRRWLVANYYYDSANFRTLDPSTQRGRRWMHGVHGEEHDGADFHWSFLSSCSCSVG
jgi:hypothetical protein